MNMTTVHVILSLVAYLCIIYLGYGLFRLMKSYHMRHNCHLDNKIYIVFVILSFRRSNKFRTVYCNEIETDKTEKRNLKLLCFLQYLDVDAALEILYILFSCLQLFPRIELQSTGKPSLQIHCSFCTTKCCKWYHVVMLATS